MSDRHLIVKAGEPLTGDDGNIVCVAAVDIFSGDALQVAQFKDWTTPVPTPGDRVTMPFLEWSSYGDVSGVRVNGVWRSTHDAVFE